MNSKLNSDILVTAGEELFLENFTVVWACLESDTAASFRLLFVCNLSFLFSLIYLLYIVITEFIILLKFLRDDLDIET